MRRDEIPQAAMLAARAMRDNPTSIAMMGGSEGRRLRRLEPLFRMLLEGVQSSPLVVRQEGTILGFASVSPAGECFFRLSLNNRHGFAVGGRRVEFSFPPVRFSTFLRLLGVGPAALGRVQQVAEAGTGHDPEEPHCHVELVVVDPRVQRRGLGRQLMATVCASLDARASLAYLETDTARNVDFYRYLGFEVSGEADPAGAHVWYMRRLPDPTGEIRAESFSFIGVHTVW
jgi:ribosomal protein S18 acetylase RimI-like enzyme